MIQEHLLGTAGWGWTVSRDTAYALLDAWLKAGFKRIDTATNYPINKNLDDFRASERMLLEYIQAHGLTDLQVTVKIGSVDNLRTPDCNLQPSFIRMIGGEYQRLFGANIDVLMLHWDNRDDPAAIRATMEALAEETARQSCRMGLSGIAHTSAYAQALREMGDCSFDIQLKNNILQSDLPRHAAFEHLNCRYYAYGINAGGVKLDAVYSDQSTFVARGGKSEPFADRLAYVRERLSVWNTATVRPPVKTMNHIGLIYNALSPRIDGIVMGVSSVAQLTETLDFYKNLEVFEYADVYKDLIS